MNKKIILFAVFIPFMFFACKKTFDYKNHSNNELEIGVNSIQEVQKEV